MDALPNTTAAPPAPPLAPALTRRQENYARAVASGLSYAEAFRQSGCVASTSGSMSVQISELNKTPKVRARITELRAAVDAETVSTMHERMSWLRLIISADPRELSRIVADACGNCWSDETYAQAMIAHFRPSPFDADDPRPGLPDTHKPRPGCIHCRGEGILRVVLTPTDELSPEGRALFKGAEQNEKGEIKIHMHDQQAAADMLNKMQSAYVTRSINLNANVAVHAARDATPADAARLLEAFGG